MSGNIYVTTVESPRTNKTLRRRQEGFRDLVPWADPYIVALVATLERQGGRLSRESRKVQRLTGDIHPPIYVDPAEHPAPRHSGWPKPSES